MPNEPEGANEPEETYEEREARQKKVRKKAKRDQDLAESLDMLTSTLPHQWGTMFNRLVNEEGLQRAEALALVQTFIQTTLIDLRGD